MILLRKHDIDFLERKRRIRLINSVTGIKPANLIGTTSKLGVSNLAIFSSVVHLGSNPPLIGCFVRPDEKVRRHTLENIETTSVYTINSVPLEWSEQAHLTSAKFEDGVSEFTQCGFREGYVEGFDAPFVKESPLSMGLRLASLIPVPLNETLLLIGEIQWIRVDSKGMEDDGSLDLGALGLAGISGLDSYYRLERAARYEEAVPSKTKSNPHEGS